MTTRTPITTAVVADIFGYELPHTDGEKAALAEIVQAADAVLQYNLMDTLTAVAEQGPTADGDVPSKTERSALLSLGLLTKCLVKGEDGYQACTYLGRDVLRVIKETGNYRP